MPRPEITRDLRGQVAHRWLGGLSAHIPSIVGLKNVERALAGIGDLDLSASAQDWDAATMYAHNAVSEIVGHKDVLGLQCDHVPSVRILLWHPGASSGLLQLDLSEALVTRGFAWALPGPAVSVSMLDYRGFRVAPQCVQAYIGLVTKASGGEFAEASRYAVYLREALHLHGQEVVRSLIALLIPDARVRRSAMSVVDLVAKEQVYGSELRALFTYSHIAALRNPGYALQRLRFRLRGPCNAARLVFTGRHCPLDTFKLVASQPGHAAMKGSN